MFGLSAFQICFKLLLVELVYLFQRKWYRNFLMKGFHIVVLLTAGPGIRDTQVSFVLYVSLLLAPQFFSITYPRNSVFLFNNVYRNWSNFVADYLM